TNPGSSRPDRAQTQTFSSPAQVAKTTPVRRSTHSIPLALSPLSFCPDTSRTDPRLLAMRKSPAHCLPLPLPRNWRPSYIARPLLATSLATSDRVPLATTWQTRRLACLAFLLVPPLQACPPVRQQSGSGSLAPTLQISDGPPRKRFGRVFRRAVPSSQLPPRATSLLSSFPELQDSPRFPAARFAAASTRHPENECALPG